MVYIVIGLNMEWQKQHINLGNVKEQYIDGEIDMMEHQKV